MDVRLKERFLLFSFSRLKLETAIYIRSARALIIITWAETFGYLEHVERERYRVDDVHSYDPRNEHSDDGIFEAAHRDGPVQRGQDTVYRPADKYQELDIAVDV